MPTEDTFVETPDRPRTWVRWKKSYGKVPSRRTDWRSQLGEAKIRIDEK